MEYYQHIYYQHIYYQHHSDQLPHKYTMVIEDTSHPSLVTGSNLTPPPSSSVITIMHTFHVQFSSDIWHYIRWKSKECLIELCKSEIQNHSWTELQIGETTYTNYHAVIYASRCCYFTNVFAVVTLLCINFTRLPSLMRLRQTTPARQSG